MITKAKAARIKRRYGITGAHFERLERRQHGLCAICRDPPGRVSLAVDHDHATGLVRGLLCVRCNLALGAFDKPGILRRLSRYLRIAAMARTARAQANDAARAAGLLSAEPRPEPEL